MQMALWGLLFGYMAANVKASNPSVELVDDLKKVGGIMSIPILLVCTKNGVTDFSDLQFGLSFTRSISAALSYNLHLEN